MTRISLVSFALILIVSHASQALADPLADKVTSMNAQWDAAINNADFDALLPLYTDDGRLMPPGARPVIGPLAIRDFFAGRGRSVRNHKVELLDVLPIGSYASTMSNFKSLLMVN